MPFPPSTTAAPPETKTAMCSSGAPTVSSWAAVIIVSREFAVTGLRLVAVGKGNVIAAGWSGKIKTVVQLVGISLILLKNPIFNLIPLNMGLILIYISVVLSIWSCVEYIVKNRQVLKG